MSFNRITPPVIHKAGQGTGIKCSVRVGKKSGTPNVILSIAKFVQQQLNIEHKRWGVCEGEDNDAGWLRMGPEAEGEFTPTVTNKGEALLFYLGELKCAPLKKQPSKFCQFRIENNCLVVKLPSWALGVDTETQKSHPAIKRIKDVSGGSPTVVSMGEPTDDFKQRREAAEKVAALEPTKKQNPAARKPRDFGFTR